MYECSFGLKLHLKVRPINRATTDLLYYSLWVCLRTKVDFEQEKEKERERERERGQTSPGTLFFVSFGGRLRIHEEKERKGKERRKKNARNELHFRVEELTGRQKSEASTKVSLSLSLS